MSGTVFAEAKQLGFAFPDGPLLQGLSFTIGPGLTLVRGGDGRGKSTLLRLIAGTLAPTSGRVQRQPGPLYFENPADRASDTVTGRAWLAALQPRFPGWSADIEQVLINEFSLAEHIDKPLYMLSTGSRRKVGLVGAAASGAPLTLLDTPFAALDGPSRDRLARLLAEAAAGAGRAWVIADYELPPGLAGVRLSAVVDLGD